MSDARTGSYILALMFFAGAGVALFGCSTLIDYRGHLPLAVTAVPA